MRIIGVVVILVAVACAPLLSHAAGAQVTSSTQYLWYQDFLSKDTDQDDVAEYLRLNVTQLDKDGKVNVYGYGRVIRQLSTSDEIRPELGNDTFGKMYYLYLDYKDVVKEHLDLRAGRTYVSAAAVSGTIDGAYLDFKNLGPAGITVFGGRRVIFDNKSEVGTGGDALTGVSVYLNTIKFTHVELSYGRKYTDTDLAEENAGLDFSTTPHEKVNIYGRLKYDTVLDRFNEIIAGAKVAPLKDLFLVGEYYYSYATFDKESFYHFFPVNNYKEISIAAEYHITENYRLDAKYANESFGNDANGDLYEVGFSARPIKDLSVNVFYDKRNGFTGELSGIRFNGAYRIAKATISAGIDYDDFRRESARKGSAKKYWAGMMYEFNKTFNAVVRVEDNVNFHADDAAQGFVAINVNI